MARRLGHLARECVPDPGCSEPKRICHVGDVSAKPLQLTCEVVQHRPTAFTSTSSVLLALVNQLLTKRIAPQST